MVETNMAERNTLQPFRRGVEPHDVVLRPSPIAAPTSMASLNFEMASMSSMTRVCRFCSSASSSFPASFLLCSTSILLLPSPSSAALSSSSRAFSAAKSVFAASSAAPSSCAALAFYAPHSPAAALPASRRAPRAASRLSPRAPRSPPPRFPPPRAAAPPSPTLHARFLAHLQPHDLLAQRHRRALHAAAILRQNRLRSSVLSATTSMRPSTALPEI